MATVQELLGAATNCYRLTSVSEVKYTTFNLLPVDDQVLVDAELKLRQEQPKVLATIYNKELWTFSIDENDPPVVSPEFNLRQSPISSFSPSLVYRSSNGQPSSLMSMLLTTFLRSLKRLLINNLSFRGELMPLGNAGVLPDNTLLLIEPRLVENGDITISIASIDHGLTPLTDLSYTYPNVNDNYAIYLAPSGIRVYLSDGSIEQSTTVKPPNHAFIVKTLAQLHSIQIDPSSCTWIKVIPNLQHLNGMTSQISDYLKPVTNTKYLSWPLELCYTQQAEMLVNNSDGPSWKLDSSDPLTLIDDFVKLKASSHTKSPSAVPTATNTPLSVDNHPSVDHHSETRQIHQQQLQPVNSVPAGASMEIDGPSGTSMNENWSDLDEELFGDGGEITDADFNFFDDGQTGNLNLSKNSNNAHIVEKDSSDVFMSDSGIDHQNIDQTVELTDDLFDEDAQTANLVSELELLTEENETVERQEIQESKLDWELSTKDPYDIPLIEMTVPSTPPYTDPGAPLPIQSPKTAARKRSIFSPLNFNPIIKSNVDDKYANGGRFFVPTVDSPTLRESSIPTVSLHDSFGQDEGDDDDSEDDDDDDDDDDEDDDDDDDERPRASSSDEGELSHVRIPLDNLSTPVKSSVETSLEPDPKRLKPNDENVLDSNIPPSNNGSMSPESALNGVPNPLPFLLRAIPIYSMPSLFYRETPVIQLDDLDDVLNQIIWDDSSLHELLTLDALNEETEHESITRAIAQVFPDIHKETLAEFAGLGGSLSYESPISGFKDSEYTTSTHSLNVEFASTMGELSPKGHVQTNNFVFQVPQPRLRVRRLSQEISVNSIALNFWNLMSFNSLNPPKSFRVLLFAPGSFLDHYDYFLTSLIQVYEKVKLGNVERISIPNSNIKNSILSLDVNNFESSMLESARALYNSLLTDPNDNEILVLFPSFEDDISSTIKLVKLFKKFKSTMTSVPNGKALPLKVTLKIIPNSYIMNHGVLSVVSINKLTRLSLSIYNLVGDFNSTYTQLAVPLPHKINFQLTKQPVASKLLSQESFIHLAYERSRDKEWCVAAWTDEHSFVREVKSFHCTSKVKNSLENVMNDIWSKTLALATQMAGKKYLVLTRSDGAIPDDELLQWKRLSSSSRDLTLIVISVNQDSRLLVQLSDPSYPIKKIFNQDAPFGEILATNKLDSIPTVGSSTGLTPSAIFTPQPVNSPDPFTIGRPITHESPSDFRVSNDEQGIIVDVSDIVHAIIIDGPTALANSPARLGIKTGYLIKPMRNSKNRLKVFEMNLMSCPGTFPRDDLMRTLLIQFRNLATIAEVLSVVGPEESLIPWHVLAVRKGISCLNHIRVESKHEAK